MVDENDIEVPDGTAGELVIRSARPWALMKGYYNNPKATVEAMRNGWFHTGDSFRKDENGVYFFVDRLKDVIRRRGENISSFALEAEVLFHDTVKECATIAVPSELSEDEVLIAVTPVEGQEIVAGNCWSFSQVVCPASWCRAMYEFWNLFQRRPAVKFRNMYYAAKALPEIRLIASSR